MANELAVDEMTLTCPVAVRSTAQEEPRESDESPSDLKYQSEDRLHNISSAPIYGDYTYKFPWLTGSELEEYKRYTRKSFDLLAIGPVTFFITVFYIAHANFENALSDGPLFTAGLVFGLIASILFYLIFIFAHGARSFAIDTTNSKIMREFSTLVFYSIYLEDIIAVLATLSASCYLYARVWKGQCLPDVTLWVSSSSSW